MHWKEFYDIIIILKYIIKKIKPQNISKNYIDTINHVSTKKFIYFSKRGKNKKTKIDLQNYIKKLGENEFLFGIFQAKIHVANFKLTIKEKKIYIGFLVFLKYQGKSIIKNSFTKILKIKIFKINKFKKIFLGVDEKNLNAVKLYKKLGFKYKKNSKKIMYLNL